MGLTNAHKALIYTMLLVSAADAEMSDAEMKTIGESVKFLPVFQKLKEDSFTTAAREVVAYLQKENGLDVLLEIIQKDLPASLHETAYLLATEVAASDREIHQEELRILEMIQQRLHLDPLTVAALERGTRARFASI